jgi:hypothetical protein
MACGRRRDAGTLEVRQNSGAVDTWPRLRGTMMRCVELDDGSFTNDREVAGMPEKESDFKKGERKPPPPNPRKDRERKDAPAIGYVARKGAEKK